MLPLRLSDTWATSVSRAEGGGRHHGVLAYARRLLHVSHMDIEATSALMLNLLIRPSRVYRTTAWHRQTKGQWARDDPAFLTIQFALLVVASIAWGVAFAGSALEVLRLVLWSALVDYLFVGLFVSTLLWLLANHILRTPDSSTQQQQQQQSSLPSTTSAVVDAFVEWGYAFDVHQNGFFPLFLVTHVLQLFLAPLLLSKSGLSCLLSALLYGVAGVYYIHITFLGYHAHPALRRTVWLLYPAAFLAIAALLCPLLHINPSLSMLQFYFPSSVVSR